MSLALRANRAASRLKLEKYPEAEADANWVLNKDPRHVKATHRRAAARAKMGQYAGALEDYAVVKRAFPRHKGVAEEIEIVEGLAFEASEKARDARRSRPESPAFGKTKVKSPKPDAAPPAVSGEDAAEALKKEGNAAVRPSENTLKLRKFTPKPLKSPPRTGPRLSSSRTARRPT
jgi:tetratricopeptide (TPR) repeat protein